MQAKPNTSGVRSPADGGPSAQIDLWTMLDLLGRHKWWLAAGVIAGGVAAFLAGSKIIKPKFTASAQLLRYETPGAGDFFKPDAPMTPDTFGGLIRAPDLLSRVGEMAVPPIPLETFVKQIKVDPDDESDLVNVALVARAPQQAVDLLNIYLTNAVEYLTGLQAQEVRRSANTFLGKQVEQMDQDIADLDKEFRNLALPPQITNKVAQIGGQLNQLHQTLARPSRASPAFAMETDKLNQAMEDLAILLSKYTELHPLVQQKEAEVQAWKARLAADSTNTFPLLEDETVAAPIVPAARPTAETFNPEIDIVRARLLSLEQGRVQVVNRQREVESYLAHPPGIARVFAPASLKTVHAGLRGLKIAIATVVGALGGLAGSFVIVIFTEFVDGRLKTVEDLRRVTDLPVLTSLGDISKMDAATQSLWAFRTWTMLQGLLSPTAHHGLVCGFTSSSRGEGRTTWIRMLAEAASLTGFRVLTVATRPSGEEINAHPNHAGDFLAEHLEGTHLGEKLAACNGDALSSPAQIAERLTEPGSPPVVHIPLPGWVWNRERRQQWHDALERWRQIENIVILVELPPAEVPEAVLLGASLPNLVWLAGNGCAHADQTRDQLKTLRDARCKIVGAVFNREGTRSLKSRFPRWIPYAAMLACLAWSGARAQPSTSPAVDSPGTNLAFSIVHPSQRAAWQEHLTVGPGDVLNIGLFGQPELAVQDVAIGPDGRVSFLEAQDVMASGLTIDELRGRLDGELSKYRRAPHTVISPVAFRSKKYFMLGKVMVKGAYVLDRPLTVLEAIARAKGFENGLVDRSVVDLADFSRSFIARGGKRLPLSFEKLFENGDLSQNIPVEPGDYIYIAPVDLQEVYVVGEIRLPGPVTYSPGETVIEAIAARGGFTERAYRGRVLVVRGSLGEPERFAVNTAEIVTGKTPDFTLQPKDIIYISPRPFVRVEELADLATTAFIQGLITAWVDVKVVKPFAN